MRAVLLILFFITHSLFAQVKKEPGVNGMYIAEWDLAFPTLEKMNEYYGREKLKSNSLIINTIGDKRVFDQWPMSQRRNLTYCVSNEFKEYKKDVVEAMKIATQDWMDTGADIRFLYKKHEDGNCTERNLRVVFDIRPANAGLYLARAFFPSYPRVQRNIMIDSSSFKHSFVAFSGFLRHELGHVLGFRHEHISASSIGACPEGGSYSPVTSYDQYSVMHYPQCGGKNNIQNMVLSMLDAEGILKVYSRR